MKKIHFDIENGTLMLDETIISPLNKSKFLDTIKNNSIIFEIHNSNSITDNFSLEGEIDAQKFGINLFFKNEIIEILWLAWDGGNSKKFGYNITENQLISDKNNLTKMLIKTLKNILIIKEKQVTFLIFNGGGNNYFSLNPIQHSINWNVVELNTKNTISAEF